MKRYDMTINRLCILNGFKGSGEAADLLNLYTHELRRILNRDPIAFLNLIMKAKKLKAEKQNDETTS